MQFRNLTPHAVRIRFDASNDPSPVGSDLVLSPEKVAIRISENVVSEQVLGGVKIRLTQLGQIEGLPVPVEGMMLVVSMPVAERAYKLGRKDVVSPDSGEDAIRFELPNGNEGIYAVRALRFIDGK